MCLVSAIGIGNLKIIDQKMEKAVRKLFQKKRKKNSSLEDSWAYRLNRGIDKDQEALDEDLSLNHLRNDTKRTLVKKKIRNFTQTQKEIELFLF